MAAVVEQKQDFSARYGSEVERQIAEATGRIRTHDLTLGGLTLASLVAIYATGMILLDKYLNLSEGVRQLALVGFLAGFGAVGYFLVARPLRRRINPLYAAAAVERTIDNPKNSVTGYVEAHETGDVSAAVKAAMSARAARAVGEADVNRAVDHRNLLIAGAVLVVFVLALTALFFVFRPSQFTSLVGRAFVPFSSDPIATRTQLALVKPEPPDVTITSGQTVTVAVHVGGKVPPKDNPTRVRLLVRYNPADPTYEELPLEEGETTRDWQLQVPVDRVLNGFWYKVAAGDAETPEHRVTVRSLPRFTEFEARFKYPAYTRKPDDKTRDHDFKAYRGTRVTLAAKTNREVRDGVMRFDAPGLAPVPGRPSPADPETLVFDFTASERTGYRLSMTTAGGEKFSDPRTYQVTLEPDNAPVVFITGPEAKTDDPEPTLPANGLLEVNGTVGDDFGIDKVRLVLKADGRPLQPLPAEGGRSFRREADGTWPKDYGYKGSADFTKLLDEKGQPFEPREGTVIEYSLEAIDNCTEAKPHDGWGEKPQAGNVGRSKPQTVRLMPPKTAAEDKQQLDQQKQERTAEEQQHNQRQQQKFDKEDRTEGKKDADRNNQKKDDGKKGGESKEGDNKEGEGIKGGEKEGEPKEGEPKAKQNPKGGGKGQLKGGEGGTPPPKPDSKPDPKTDAKADPKQPGDAKGGMPDPGMKQPEGKQSEGKQPPSAKAPEGSAGGRKNDTKEDRKADASPPKGGNDAGMGERNPQPKDEAPPPKSAEDKAVEKQADQFKKELDRDKRPEGEAKPNTAPNPGERADPSQPKPQPKDGPPQDSQAKEGPKPTDPGNPMPKPGEKDKDQNTASESKPAGDLEKPTDPAQPKPAPKEPNPKAPGKKDDAPPAERREEPLGGAPGEEKPEPKAGEAKKDGQPGAKESKEPKDSNKDPKSGSAGKPCENPKAGDPTANPGAGGGMGEQPPQPKTDPAADAGKAKPKGEPDRGRDRAGDPNAGPAADDKKNEASAGEAKPQATPEAAGTKPPPKKDDTRTGGEAGKQPDASSPKPAPKDADGMNPKEPGKAAESRGDQQDPKGMGDAVEKGMDRADQKNPPGGPKGKENDPTAAKDGKNPKGGGGSKEPPKQPSPEELKKLEDAAKNLDNPDPTEQKKARETLDKAIGEDKRKELEQLQKDLKSEDKNTRDAAQKKVEDLMNKAKDEVAKKDNPGGEPKKDNTTRKDGSNGPKKEGDTAGKKLSPEEIADLAKKASDLNSKDDDKRREAEKALDDKIGEDARKKLQEEMAKRPPKNPDDPQGMKDLQNKIDEFAKNPPGRGPATDDIKGHGAGGNSESGKPLEDDPKNRAKTAQLQLEEFEKNRYNKDLQDRLGWTQEQMDGFLEAQARRVAQMQKEADGAEHNPEPKSPEPPSVKPKFDIGNLGGKVTGPEGGPKVTGSGPVFAPPGFEKAKLDFQKAAAEKLPPKK